MGGAQTYHYPPPQSKTWAHAPSPLPPPPRFLRQCYVCHPPDSGVHTGAHVLQLFPMNSKKYPIMCTNPRQFSSYQSLLSPVLYWGAMVCLSPPPTHTLLTPHFYFPLELYVYIKLKNNYLAFLIYQLIILWTISIN